MEEMVKKADLMPAYETGRTRAFWAIALAIGEFTEQFKRLVDIIEQKAKEDSDEE